MKKKDLQELKTKTTLDLLKKIDQLQKEIPMTRLELAMGKLKNIHQLREKRQDLARLKTILKVMEFSQNRTQKEEKDAPI